MADTFLRASQALDRGRAAITATGARPYRSYFVVQVWSGATAGEGTVNTYLDEIGLFQDGTIASPKVRFLNHASDQGFQQEEDALLSKISRVEYSREQILGLSSSGGSRPANETFHIGLLPREQIYMTLYEPVSEPKLEKTAWNVRLRPKARLSDSAEVLLPSRVSDGAGGFTLSHPSTGNFIDVIVRDLRGDERRVGEQDQAEITVVVFCGVLETVERGNRLLVNGRTLNVVDVRQPRHPGDHKELDCTEDVRGS